MEKPYLIKAAQFAKLCGISKDTLLYYDHIGVLRPYQVADNGTRFYLVEQLNTFRILSFLQGSGCSLKDIRKFLSCDNPAEFLPLMKQKKKYLLLKQDEINQSLRSLELLMFVLELSETKRTFVRMDKPVSLLITPIEEEHQEEFDRSRTKYLEHVQKIASHHTVDSYPIGIMFDSEDVRRKSLRPRYYYSVCDNHTPGAVSDIPGVWYREVIKTTNNGMQCALYDCLQRLDATGERAAHEVHCDCLIGDMFADLLDERLLVLEVYILIIGNGPEVTQTQLKGPNLSNNADDICKKISLRP